MFLYHAHGLNILSEINFPELSKSELHSCVDLIICFKTFTYSKEKIRECSLTSLKVKFLSNNVYFSWEEVDICAIINKNKIIISPVHDLDQSFLRFFILSIVIPFLLHLNGRLVLHSSAVDMNGAVAFLGESGRGKSTISLSLYNKGYKLISDDMLSIFFDLNNYPYVYPGIPRIRIWPEVLKNLGKNPEIITKIHSNTEKRAYFVKNFSYQPVPLKAIYILEKDQKTSIKKVNSIDYLNALIENSYCYSLFNNNELSGNLMQCTNLLNTLPLKVLTINHSFEDIPNIVKIIENDVINFKK